MNNWYIDLKVENERHKDEARRAAEYRLVREAARRPPSIHPDPMHVAIHWRWLARLGALLVTWGCRLQTRSADAALYGVAAFTSSSSTESCSS